MEIMQFWEEHRDILDKGSFEYAWLKSIEEGDAKTQIFHVSHLSNIKSQLAKTWSRARLPLSHFES